MNLSTQIKPISYLKAHAADIVNEMGRDGQPLIITQNGEAKAVVQSLREYERTQEALAMMKIMAIGRKEIDAGEHELASEYFARVRKERGFS